MGDSRAYRLRGNRFEQLTFDHSLVWEMRASGQLQGQVPDYVPKNVITRSLGPAPRSRSTWKGRMPVVPGDTFLMCSDGLSGPVKDEEMGMILFSMPPVEVVRGLVDLANLRGGPDNITVIVVKAVGETWAQASNGGYERAQRRSIQADPSGLVRQGRRGLGEPDLAGTRRRQNRRRRQAIAYGRGPYSAAICSPRPISAGNWGRPCGNFAKPPHRPSWNSTRESVNAFLDRAAAGLRTATSFRPSATTARASASLSPSSSGKANRGPAEREGRT